MSQKIENKIRINLILIIVLFITVCGLIFFYLYKYSNNIDFQKKNINQYYIQLHETNELIHLINHTQSEANFFVTTKHYKHFNNFRELLSEIDHIIDTLTKISQESDQNIITILQEINTTLKEKGLIVSELNNLFIIQNPFTPINEKLQAYETPLIVDTILVSTITHDTIIKTTKRENFWKRLFSSKNNDSLIKITTSKTDTLQIHYSDSIDIIAEMSDYTQKASDDYISHINTIEKQVSNLIIADQEISSKISDLLIDLYSHIIYSRIEEIEQNENVLNKYNNYSKYGVIIALLTILIFVIIIIRNVNKGYTLRKSLEEANIKTNEIMDSRHKLLLSVSHDIKTPLNSILGYLELYQNKNELSLKDLNSMQNSGKHILSLLDNLLKFSSLQQGSLKATYNNFYINELCLEIIEMLSPLALQKNISFEYIPEFDSNIYINSDPLKIKQILINIISNSIKYTIKGEISFKAKQYNNKLHFIINDTGIGMPAKDIENIYKPFFRIDNNNNIADGSGFGMYVVKGLVDILNGDINIKSEINKGTEVEVIIPIEIIPEHIITSLKKILIIDDDITFLHMLKDMFLLLGFEPTLCNTISEFEEHLRSTEKYDLILTDMEMDAISGAEILKMTQQFEINIPVVVMTARSDFDLKKAKDLGFDSYLSKPINISSIKQILGTPDNQNYDLNTLNKMFDNDFDTISEILETFILSTKENIILLNESILYDDFLKAQAVCHKMLPMFMQLGANNISLVLKKIDGYRNKENNIYSEWKFEISSVMPEIENLIENISKQLNSNH